MAALLHHSSEVLSSFCGRAKQISLVMKSMSTHSGKAEKCLKAMSKLYVGVFGDKWPMMLHEMQLDKSYCALVNKMLPESVSTTQSLQKDLGAVELILRSSHKVAGTGKPTGLKSTSQLTCLKSNKMDFAKPRGRLEVGSKLPYFLMDFSSLIPVLALDVKSNDFVLDMCSSPGGKTLAIAMQLSVNGQLVSNEFDSKRRKRLLKVIDEYVPKSVIRYIKVTNLNGKSFGENEPSTFDKVLVDAPCSSDRHVIQDEFRHSGWSVRKSREFSELQKELLLSAILAVKRGGVVVYSTCTLSPLENDDVITFALAETNNKFNIKMNVIDFVEDLNTGEFCIIETMKHGVLVVPTQTQNWGPMYTCKLVRAS